MPTSAATACDLLELGADVVDLGGDRLRLRELRAQALDAGGDGLRLGELGLQRLDLTGLADGFVETRAQGDGLLARGGDGARAVVELGDGDAQLLLGGLGLGRPGVERLAQPVELLLGGGERGLAGLEVLTAAAAVVLGGLQVGGQALDLDEQRAGAVRLLGGQRARLVELGDQLLAVGGLGLGERARVGRVLARGLGLDAQGLELLLGGLGGRLGGLGGRQGGDGRLLGLLDGALDGAGTLARLALALLELRDARLGLLLDPRARLVGAQARRADLRAGLLLGLAGARGRDLLALGGRGDLGLGALALRRRLVELGLRAVDRGLGALGAALGLLELTLARGGLALALGGGLHGRLELGDARLGLGFELGHLRGQGSFALLRAAGLGLRLHQPVRGLGRGEVERLDAHRGVVGALGRLAVALDGGGRGALGVGPLALRGDARLLGGGGRGHGGRQVGGRRGGLRFGLLTRRLGCVELGEQLALGRDGGVGALGGLLGAGLGGLGALDRLLALALGLLRAGGGVLLARGDLARLGARGLRLLLGGLDALERGLLAVDRLLRELLGLLDLGLRGACLVGRGGRGGLRVVALARGGRGSGAQLGVGQLRDDARLALGGQLLLAATPALGLVAQPDLQLADGVLALAREPLDLVAQLGDPRLGLLGAPGLGGAGLGELLELGAQLAGLVVELVGARGRLDGLDLELGRVLAQLLGLRARLGPLGLQPLRLGDGRGVLGLQPLGLGAQRGRLAALARQPLDVDRGAARGGDARRGDADAAAEPGGAAAAARGRWGGEGPGRCRRRAARTRRGRSRAARAGRGTRRATRRRRRAGRPSGRAAA